LTSATSRSSRCAASASAPGFDRSGGSKVLFAPNLGWEDVSLKKELEKLLGVPVFLENDCNIATLGVYESE